MNSVVCPNCQSSVLLSSFDTHEAYCYRNHVRCNLCHDFYDKRDPQPHLFWHETVTCKDCHSSLQRFQLNTHQSDCRGNKIICDYCSVDIQINEFEDHAKRCGSRTYRCDMCKETLLVRNENKHLCVEQYPQSRRERLVRKMSEDEDCEIVEIIKKNRVGEQRRLELRGEILKGEKERQGEVRKQISKRNTKSQESGNSNRQTRMEGTREKQLKLSTESSTDLLDIIEISSTGSSLVVMEEFGEESNKTQQNQRSRDVHALNVQDQERMKVESLPEEFSKRNYQKKDGPKKSKY